MLVSLIGTSAFATEQYTKVDRIKDMLTMADAMGMIQKGILFRNKDNRMIKLGIKEIKKTLHTIQKVDAKDFLDDEQLYAQKFAKKTAILLEMYLHEMEESIRLGKPDEVIHNYSLALRQCTSCHLRLRK
ncbi:MAG: hypothetical protein ABFQ64_09865 [Campylobacterota bacterium]